MATHTLLPAPRLSISLFVRSVWLAGDISMARFVDSGSLGDLEASQFIWGEGPIAETTVDGNATVSKIPL